MLRTAMGLMHSEKMRHSLYLKIKMKIKSFATCQHCSLSVDQPTVDVLITTIVCIWRILLKNGLFNKSVVAALIRM